MSNPGPTSSPGRPPTDPSTISRNAKRGEAARQAIAEATGNANVFLLLGDVSLEADVRSLWAEFERHSSEVRGLAALQLNALVTNAGALLNERTLSAEGVEVTFASHFLFGTYLLGKLAIPCLEATEGGRMVVVSSGGMYNTKWPKWERAVSYEGQYDGQLAYAYAKRGQVLLCEQWAKAHPSVAFVSSHPGWTATPAVDAAYGTPCSSPACRARQQDSSDPHALSTAPQAIRENTSSPCGPRGRARRASAGFASLTRSSSNPVAST